MLSFLFTFAFLLVISFSQINAVPAPGPDSQGRNLVQFGNMIAQTLNSFPLNYNGYGCWCGFGGEGAPVDATDACCQAHDQCYGDIMDSRANVFSCSPYLSIYTWNLDPITQLPVCEDEPGSCGHQVCECDRIVTECYKQNVNTFNKSLKCQKE